jgi:hypothetical protein
MPPCLAFVGCKLIVQAGLEPLSSPSLLPEEVGVQK